MNVASLHLNMDTHLEHLFKAAVYLSTTDHKSTEDIDIGFKNINFSK